MHALVQEQIGAWTDARNDVRTQKCMHGMLTRSMRSPVTPQEGRRHRHTITSILCRHIPFTNVAFEA
eukprot:6210925-Pleurochrysis_carterae.AAC.2